MSDAPDGICAIGKVDDGTLRMCCSTHRFILCAHHYAITHFVETSPDHDRSRACNRTPLVAVDALTEAMVLPIVAVPDPAPPGAESVGAASHTAQGPPRRNRQQGRIQDYGRRAG